MATADDQESKQQHNEQENYSRTLTAENSFTPKLLLMEYPEIKLVIDLSNTNKYYNGEQEFVSIGVQYVKIWCRGGEIPKEGQFKKFAKVVKDFLRSNPSNYLIAVHCTHGVNRTGYFIVRFMIENMGYNSEKALQEFLRCRGHPINRTVFTDDLLKKSGKAQKNAKPNSSKS